MHFLPYQAIISKLESLSLKACNFFCKDTTFSQNWLSVVTIKGLQIMKLLLQWSVNVLAHFSNACMWVDLHFLI